MEYKHDQINSFVATILSRKHCRIHWKQGLLWHHFHLSGEDQSK